MKFTNYLCLITLINLFHFTNLSSQETIVGGDDKMTSLLETKYLKTGEIVTLEKIQECGIVRVRLITPEGEKKNDSF